MVNTTNPLSRGNIKPEKTLETASKPQTSEEIEDWAKQREELINRQLKQDITEREKYANRSFWLVVGWIVAILAVVGLQGFSDKTGFSISDNVLMTLIGGTTINILGIFIVVANYLFPKTNAAPRTSVLNGGKQQG